MSCHVFTEYEAYKDAHEDVDLSLTLSHPDRSSWSVRNLRIDSLHIQSASDGCGDIAEGVTRRDGWILYFQTTGLPQLANGVELTRDSVVVAGPGTEFCFASQSRHDWTTVFFPIASLFPSTEDEQSGSPSVIQVVRPGRAVAQRLQATVGRFMVAAEAERTVATETASVTSFREDLCSVAQRIVRGPTPPAKAKCRSVNRRHLVSQAIEQIDGWPDMSPTIPELSRRVHASERTLQQAFAEYLGMSPYQYMTARRLNHARQLLLKSDPRELSVRQAAAKVGLWDFGRFAGKYRKLFGELPSETLQRNRTNS